MAIGVVKFSRKWYKIRKVFGQKINCSHMKSLNFANWCNGEVSKSAKSWIPKSIFYFKNYSNISDFFSWKKTNLGAHFLLLTFFDNINFQITLFPKMMSNFWHLPTNPILKIQYFPLSMLILVQKSFSFCIPGLENSTTRIAILQGVAHSLSSQSLQRVFANQRKAVKIDEFCRFIFPIGFTIFNLCYWNYYQNIDPE